MENNTPDDTIKEILDEDRTHMRKNKRGKGCFLRLLIITVLLFIGFYGFILIRQKLLDMEAEALIRARQTLTTQAGQMETAPLNNSGESDEATTIVEATADPLLERTATVQAQLTSVAEFQLTVTPQQ
ncbi:MAG: hypothetical protein FJZ98_08225 [Chloroflexi bacterium]|nr:hypothetical protein [Chloroflexota bacterium]